MTLAISIIIYILFFIFNYGAFNAYHRNHYTCKTSQTEVILSASLASLVGPLSFLLHYSWSEKYEYGFSWNPDGRKYNYKLIRAKGTWEIRIRRFVFWALVRRVHDLEEAKQTIKEFTAPPVRQEKSLTEYFYDGAGNLIKSK